jgi:hypothetical protein
VLLASPAIGVIRDHAVLACSGGGVPLEGLADVACHGLADRLPGNSAWRHIAETSGT